VNGTVEIEERAAYEAIVIPENNSTPVITETVSPKLSVETRTDVLVAIGFFEPADIIDDTAIVSDIREWDGFESVIGVAADDFDFGTAMKTELGYLRDDGMVVGLTDEDVDEIASASVRGTAGFNSRLRDNIT